MTSQKWRSMSLLEEIVRYTHKTEYSEFIECFEFFLE